MKEKLIYPIITPSDMDELKSIAQAMTSNPGITSLVFGTLTGASHAIYDIVKGRGKDISPSMTILVASSGAMLYFPQKVYHPQIPAFLGVISGFAYISSYYLTKDIITDFKKRRQKGNLEDKVQ